MCPTREPTSGFFLRLPRRFLIKAMDMVHHVEDTSYTSTKITGWCSTPTLLLICSPFSRENGHPLLICSSLSTSQIRFLRWGGDSPKVPQSSQTESSGFPRNTPETLGHPGTLKNPITQGKKCPAIEKRILGSLFDGWKLYVNNHRLSLPMAHGKYIHKANRQSDEQKSAKRVYIYIQLYMYTKTI